VRKREQAMKKEAAAQGTKKGTVAWMSLRMAVRRRGAKDGYLVGCSGQINDMTVFELRHNPNRILSGRVT